MASRKRANSVEVSLTFPGFFENPLKVAPEFIEALSGLLALVFRVHEAHGWLVHAGRRDVEFAGASWAARKAHHVETHQYWAACFREGGFRCGVLGRLNLGLLSQSFAGHGLRPRACLGREFLVVGHIAGV
jgi:hypothetical protein